MNRRQFVLVLSWTLWLTPLLAAEPPAQWLLVTAPAFRAALEPLCEHRKSQGLRVTVVETTDVLDDKEILAGEANKLRAHVNKLCRDFKGASYVLLVGAVDPGKGETRLPEAAKKVVPTLAGTTGRMKGAPSDNGYGCPGDGLLPTVAVGRFPARTAAEASQMATKTLAYENDRQPGDWRRRLTVLAGAPLFNPTVDALVESVAMSRLGRLDLSWQGRAIYHNPSSRFCVPDGQLRATALQYLQEGQAVILYLGHSDAVGFAAFTPEGRRARYLDRDDWARLAIARGPGIFATFGCFGCQLKGADGEGYGLAAMRNPRGPVAVLGSHGICFAAMVNLAADGLLDSLAAADLPDRLGGLWLNIKTGLARGPIDFLTFRLLDAVDGDSTIPQATQRLEHLEMFLLLGDPALKLPTIPRDLTLRGGDIMPGEALHISGTVPARLEGAKVRRSLERPFDSLPRDLQSLEGKSPAERDPIVRANHARANRFVLSEAEAVVKDGGFTARLAVPDVAPWPRLTLRAHAATAREEGLGVLALPVRKP